MKAQVPWPPYSETLTKHIKLVQGFIKSKRAEKVNLFLEKVKEESTEVWERIIQIHKIESQNLLNPETENREQQKEEDKEENKQSNRV